MLFVFKQKEIGKVILVLLIIMLFFLFILTGCSEKARQNIKENDTENTTEKEIKEEIGLNEDHSVGKSAYNLLGRDDNIPLDNKEAFISWQVKRTDEEEYFIGWRWDRAYEAIKRKDITNKRVLEAFLRTPREIFAREHNRKRAYSDAALVLLYGQTISGPHMVSRMSNVLNPEPHQRVLEIGTGSGYQSAIFSQLCHNVFTIEIIEPLARETAELQENLSAKYPAYRNIKTKIADGYYGWPEYAPFDRIAVTCGIDHIPPPLLEQLSLDGIMVIPVGPPDGQTLLKVTKKMNQDGSITIEREDVYKGGYYPVFVPFTAEGGKKKHSIKRDKPSQ